MLAATMLMAATITAALSAAPPSDDELRQMGLSPYDGASFRVWSDAQPRVVEGFMKSLDRLVDVFALEADRQGWELAPPSGKHLVIFFESERGFADAKRVFGGDSSRGFYSTGRQCSVFFDVRNAKDAIEAGSNLAQRQGDIAKLIEDAKQARRVGATARASELTGKARALEAKVTENLAQLNASCLESLTSVTTHEGAHQLLFERGVQVAGAKYPAWVAEGLAVCFETTDATQPFGPTRRSARRQEAWRDIVVQDRPDPLPSIITRARPPEEGDGSLQVKFYAESGALVAWMMQQRRTELANYLAWFKTDGRGRTLSPEQQLETFEHFFGPVSSVERAWQRYELAATPSARDSRWATDLMQQVVPDPRPAIRRAAESTPPPPQPAQTPQPAQEPQAPEAAPSEPAPASVPE